MRAGRLGLFRLEKRRDLGDLTTTFQYLQSVYKKDGDGLFSKVCCNRSRHNGFPLKEGSFILDIIKKCYGEDGEMLEQAVQRGGRCPSPENIQGQVA